jgi:hypothetical protein
VQHREGIYWCPAPLRVEDQRSYKVRSVAEVQVAPPPPVASMSPTQRSRGTVRRPPRHAMVHPRSPHHDARGRLRGRYPPPRPQPRLRRRRRGGGSRPGPRCRWTPPRRVPTSKPLTLKKTRATCSHRRQQWLRRREGRRRRCPAQRLGRRGDPHRAPTQRTTQGRTKGGRRPRPSLASRILGRQPSKSAVLLTT